MTHEEAIKLYQTTTAIVFPHKVPGPKRHSVTNIDITCPQCKNATKPPRGQVVDRENHSEFNMVGYCTNCKGLVANHVAIDGNGKLSQIAA